MIVNILVLWKILFYIANEIWLLDLSICWLFSLIYLHMNNGFTLNIEPIFSGTIVMILSVHDLMINFG